jgi:hypothetical protein
MACATTDELFVRDKARAAKASGDPCAPAAEPLIAHGGNFGHLGVSIERHPLCVCRTRSELVTFPASESSLDRRRVAAMRGIADGNVVFAACW